MKNLLVISIAILPIIGCTKMNETAAPETKTAETKSAAVDTAPPATYESDILDWRKKRVERLTSEDSWLTLVGLYWLNEGTNQIGSDKAENNILLTGKAPAKVGTMQLSSGKVTFVPAVPVTIRGDKAVEAPAGKPIELKNDTEADGPTVIGLGTMSFQVIKRNERFGVRVKDPESDARKHFAGIDYFPVDPKWRVVARYEPYDPPKKIPITNVIGMTAEETSPGALVFEVGGKTHRLDPILEAGSEELFIIFRDQTSADATYPAGRYLYAAKPGADGSVVVDFNKAYNPPCAFTEFATCPLPPLQNKLPFRIEAGEKKYGKGH